MSAQDDLPNLLNDCVHCGFCLPTCPTYVLWGEEMDSPRGRIHLMQQHAEGAPLSGPMVEHFDRCLGCMACVTSCPSGVQYDRLIEITRADVENEHPRSLKERAIREMVFRLFPYKRRLRALRGPLRAYQKSGLEASSGAAGSSNGSRRRSRRWSGSPRRSGRRRGCPSGSPRAATGAPRSAC